MRSVIGAARLFIFLLSAIFTIVYQSILMLLTKGPASLIYPRAYHDFCRRLLGIKIIVEGEIEPGPNVVYVGNHISYLDVQVLGSLLKGSFIAKKEVENWPLFGLMGKMGRTLYISRAPADATMATKMISDRLEEGLPLIVFPEGTSSSGTEILPFKSSFFEVFLNKNIKIQPFTISVLEVDGQKAATAVIRDKYAWHGDMTLEPHLWSFAKSKGAVVKVIFQKPVLSNSFQNRKLLSAACYEGVSKGLDLSSIAA
jgi:1-acyl-sn-glycerol-3-phosphate acyltransferase